MKDMGEAAHILGVKISRNRSKKLLSLSQEPYIKKILERFQMQACKPIETLITDIQALSRRLCPETLQKKGTNEKSSLRKCSGKFNIRNIVYYT